MHSMAPWRRGTIIAAKKAALVVVEKKRGMYGIDQDARREVERIELTIPMPPSVNALYANSESGGRFKTKAYTDWLDSAGWNVQQQHPGRIAGPYSLDIEIPRPSTKRRLDLGNREKAISDLLTKQRVIADDSLAERITLSWGPCGSDVRVVLTKWEAGR